MARGLVLIVDDEPDIRGFLSTLVGFFGYKSMTVGDGRKAVRAAAGHQPDLILMDLAMPDIDGFSAIARLKKNPQTLGIPIIAFSGLYVDGPVRTQLIDAGCSDFLHKPIDTDELYHSMVMAMRGEKPKQPPSPDATLNIEPSQDTDKGRGTIRRLIKFFKN